VIPTKCNFDDSINDALVLIDELGDNINFTETDTLILTSKDPTIYTVSILGIIALAYLIRHNDTGYNKKLLNGLSSGDIRRICAKSGINTEHMVYLETAYVQDATYALEALNPRWLLPKRDYERISTTAFIFEEWSLSEFGPATSFREIAIGVMENLC
jgi:hypothetical protein